MPASWRFGQANRSWPFPQPPLPPREFTYFQRNKSATVVVFSFRVKKGLEKPRKIAAFRSHSGGALGCNWSIKRNDSESPPQELSMG